jgi:hypothetical protein
MTDLLLRRVEARAGAERSDDYDVIGPDLSSAASSRRKPHGCVTLTRGEREDHGHERTREAAMLAFAKSWDRE